MKNILSLKKATVAAVAAVAVACSFTAAAKIGDPVHAEDNAPNFRIFKRDVTVQHIAQDDSIKIGFDGNSGVKVWYGKNKGVRLDYADIDSCDFVQTAIPVFKFHLPDYPGYDQLREKDRYLNAELDIIGNGYMEDVKGLTLQVKGRGNSTWTMPKKPMRLKFSKKTQIGELKKAKNYALLANYMDDSLMKNAIALWLGKWVGLDYVNSVIPCDVVINDYFLGSFMLTEKVGINAGSVDIDENEGILFELSTEMDETWQFRTDDYFLPVMVKDPDFDELEEDYPEEGTADERFNVWKEDLIAALKKVKVGNPFDAFDRESFAKYMFVFDIMRNNELYHPKSSYIYKKKIGKDEKYYFGPVWDFDYSADYEVKPDGGEAYENDRRGLFSRHRFFGAMFNLDEFQDYYYQYIEKFATEGIDELMAYMDEYKMNIYSSSVLDSTRWPDRRSYVWYVRYPCGDPDGRTEELKTWLKERVEYLYLYYTRLKDLRDSKRVASEASEAAEIESMVSDTEAPDSEQSEAKNDAPLYSPEERMKILQEIESNEWFEKETFAAPVDTKNCRNVLVELELSNGERVQHKVTPDMLILVKGNVLQISWDELTEKPGASSSEGGPSPEMHLTQPGSGAEGALLDVGMVESHTPIVATERKIQEYHIPKVKKMRFITSFV